MYQLNEPLINKFLLDKDLNQVWLIFDLEVIVKMEDFKRYVIVKKPFVDWFTNVFKKYYRVNIMTPMITEPEEEKDYIQFLETEFIKEGVRYQKTNDSYISRVDKRIRFLTYYISKYDFKEFDWKVMHKAVGEKYPLNDTTAPKYKYALSVFKLEVLPVYKLKMLDMCDL